MANVTIKLPPPLLNKARAKAKEQRRSLSAQMNVWIEEALKKPQLTK